MALTKASIIDRINEKLGVQRNRSSELFETMLEILKETLESGEDVMISGFGRFCVKEKAQRKGRNPATNRKMQLKARRVVTFKCSGILRDRVNR